MACFALTMAASLSAVSGRRRRRCVGQYYEAASEPSLADFQGSGDVFAVAAVRLALEWVRCNVDVIWRTKGNFSGSAYVDVGVADAASLVQVYSVQERVETDQLCFHYRFREDVGESTIAAFNSVLEGTMRVGGGMRGSAFGLIGEQEALSAGGECAAMWYALLRAAETVGDEGVPELKWSLGGDPLGDAVQRLESA